MTFKLKNSPSLEKELKKAACNSQSHILARFFKTGPGQYGEGDLFLGIKVPVIREILKDFKEVNDDLVSELLNSPYHEPRLLGALMIVDRYQRAKTEKEKKMALSFYLQSRKALNNWDLVDLSVYKIWGDYLLRHPEERAKLFKFARSKNLWERRMAIVATLALIKANQFEEILSLVKIMKNDREDLIHKALGWMLRELGKKDEKLLKKFLREEIINLPRTTLRYAIERFEESERKRYLQL